MKRCWFVILSLVGLLAAITACAPQGSSTPTPPPVTYSAPELKYLLISNFGDVFYVDRDFYPIAREGVEEQNAQQQFPAIRADAAEFSAILKHLGLPDKAEYTLDEKVAIYREHKKLTFGVELTPSVNGYTFVLRIGEGQGERIEGTITTAGKITVTKREPSFNTRPICLATGTLIDTPTGQIAVEQIAAGMSIWSPDENGKRIASVVEKTSATPVPAGFRMARVTLSDGRSVTASAGHPTAEGRPLGDYKSGDVLDGSTVIEVESVSYNGGATYDILPSGPTHSYWANGVLLMSTLNED